MDENRIWYLMQNNQKLGPFTYSELIQFQQHGELYDYQFVWNQNLTDWKRICDLEEFNRNKIQEIVKSNGASENSIISQRRFPRINVELKVIAHNEKQSFSGTCKSISEGGALIEFDSPFILPKERINLFFVSSEQSFQCIGEICKKEFFKGKINVNTKMQYVVKFLQKQSQADLFLKDLTHEIKIE